MQFGNPIYRKLLLWRFAPPTEDIPINGVIAHRYLVDDLLNFDGVLDEFKAFMPEHGVRLMKSAKIGRPLEISGPPVEEPVSSSTKPVKTGYTLWITSEQFGRSTDTKGVGYMTIT